MPAEPVRLLVALDRALVLLEVHVAQAHVVPDLPVARVAALAAALALGVHVARLLVHVDRRAVLPEQVERVADLLQVRDVPRVEARRRLEQRERVLDLPALPHDERLHVERVLAQPAALAQLVLDLHQRLVVVLAHVQQPNVPVALLARARRLGPKRLHRRPTASSLVRCRGCRRISAPRRFALSGGASASFGGSQGFVGHARAGALRTGCSNYHAVYALYAANLCPESRRPLARSNGRGH